MTTTPPVSSARSLPVSSPLTPAQTSVVIDVIAGPLTLAKLSALSPLSGTVQDVLPDQTAEIKTDAGVLTIRVPRDAPLTKGQSVRIEIPPENTATHASPTPRATLSIASQVSSVPNTLSTPHAPDQNFVTPPQSVTDFYTPATRNGMTPFPTEPLKELGQNSVPASLKAGQTISVQTLSIPDANALLSENFDLLTFGTENLGSGQNLSNSILDRFKLVFDTFTNKTVFPASFDSTAPFTSNPNILSLTSNPSFLLPEDNPLSVQIPPDEESPTFYTPNARHIFSGPSPFNFRIETITLPQDLTKDAGLFQFPIPSNPTTAQDPAPLLPLSFVVLGTTRALQSIVSILPPQNGIQNSVLFPSLISTRTSPLPVGTVITGYTPINETVRPDVSSRPLFPVPELDFLDSLDDLLAEAHAMNILPAGLGGQSTTLTPTLNALQNFGPAVLFFMAALKSGNLGAWIGDDLVDVLKRTGRADKVDKIDSLLKSLKGSISAPGSDWKSFSIPLQTSDSCIPMMIHIRSLMARRDDDQTDHKENDPHTKGPRVVIDIHFSRLGDFQIDMLAPGHLRLDTVLRTELSFSSRMQDRIRRLYAAAMEKTRMTGDVFFQTNYPKQFRTDNNDTNRKSVTVMI